MLANFDCLVGLPFQRARVRSAAPCSSTSSTSTAAMYHSGIAVSWSTLLGLFYNISWKSRQFVSFFALATTMIIEQ